MPTRLLHHHLPRSGLVQSRLNEAAGAADATRAHTPRVMPQRGVLIHRFRFRLILATAFNSVNYSQ